jgi:hypothetical protein
MKKLLIQFNKTTFNELISWFESLGHPCLSIGIVEISGAYWRVNIIYQHFEVKISDEKLYTMVCLRWS